MKMTPEYSKAQENMHAGIISSSGFLGNDSRLISDIICDDEEMVQVLGMNFTEIANRLKFFMEKALNGFGNPVTVDELWEVFSEEARGVIPCPFEDGSFKKINVYVKKKGFKDSIVFSELGIHLIEKHHFFQGKDAFFRLDPEKIKKILF
ncbi:MAG: hypothetical protein KBA07_02055 [Petrotogaceae bacterium]|jgi:hypothetical protein|nr:hypothetical protein [Petrotogaceae bacterium]